VVWLNPLNPSAEEIVFDEIHIYGAADLAFFRQDYSKYDAWMFQLRRGCWAFDGRSFDFCCSGRLGGTITFQLITLIAQSELATLPQKAAPMFQRSEVNIFAARL